MKKLISIGVALALLTMAVVPGAVAAAEYENPTTYAKIPFAILQAGFTLVGVILEGAGETLGLPEWIDADLMNDIGGFAGGPLSWTVDMLAWGVGLLGDVVGAAGAILEGMGMELPFDLEDVAVIMDTIACGLLQCWVTTNCSAVAAVDPPVFDPCP